MPSRPTKDTRQEHRRAAETQQPSRSSSKQAQPKVNAWEQRQSNTSNTWRKDESKGSSRPAPASQTTGQHMRPSSTHSVKSRAQAVPHEQPQAQHVAVTVLPLENKLWLPDGQPFAGTPMSFSLRFKHVKLSLQGYRPTSILWFVFLTYFIAMSLLKLKLILPSPLAVNRANTNLHRKCLRGTQLRWTNPRLCRSWQGATM